MNNITIIGLAVILLWISAIAIYFYVSRQQNDLEHELEDLREMLKSTEGEQEGMRDQE